ncbi:MAG TPA: 4-hydroxybenzoyl-CoA thioesterase, partial [Rhodoferax sp.]|nr:4-hydroxybenzoyl-CoA thioesterase [Rhodoferax sp.]
MTMITLDATRFRHLLRAAEPDTLRIELGDWSSLAESARAVRLEVFVQEQQIPLALEQDSADADA